QRSTGVAGGKEIRYKRRGYGAPGVKIGGIVATGDNITAPAGTEGGTGFGRRFTIQGDPTKSAFFWLSIFFVVYCARPGDWVPLLGYIPLAKISGILAMWGLFNSVGRTKRTLKDLPK